MLYKTKILLIKAVFFLLFQSTKHSTLLKTYLHFIMECYLCWPLNCVKFMNYDKMLKCGKIRFIQEPRPPAPPPPLFSNGPLSFLTGIQCPGNVSLITPNTFIRLYYITFQGVIHLVRSQTYVYLVVRNASSLETFAYIQNEWSPVDEWN